MNYYKRALELREETVAHRRYFHTNAEVGLVMPKAKAYIMEKLRSAPQRSTAAPQRLGCAPKFCPVDASCYAHCATQWLKNNK